MGKSIQLIKPNLHSALGLEAAVKLQKCTQDHWTTKWQNGCIWLCWYVKLIGSTLERVPCADGGERESTSQILSHNFFFSVLLMLTWESSETFGFLRICTAIFAAAEMFCVVSWLGMEVRIWVLLAIAETLLVSAISTYQGNAIQQKENKKGKKDSSF